LPERLGRNQRFSSTGNLVAAALMGLIGYFWSYQAIFLTVAALTLPLFVALARIRAADIHFGLLVTALLFQLRHRHFLLAAFGPNVVLRPGYRKALIEASIVTNAALAAYSIQQEFRGSEPTEMQTVYGVYLLETREVWAPCPGNMQGIGLAAAPQDLSGFVELGEAIVQSRRIASYISLEQ